MPPELPSFAVAADLYGPLLSAILLLAFPKFAITPS